MAYVSLTPSQIQPGKAVKSELFTQIKDNEDDLHSRLTTVESGANKVEVFDFDFYNSSSAQAANGVTHYKAKSDFRITSVSVEMFELYGLSSGTLQIDIKKNATAEQVGMLSILTTLPTVNFATATAYTEYFGVLDPIKQFITAGDIIQLDLTSLPSTPFPKFRVVVFGEI